jgi:hypothetical protein
MVKVIRILAAVAMTVGVAQAQTFGSKPADKPATASSAPAASAATGSDFDRVNPGIGFGWFGISDIPVGADEVVSAPVIGIRWWMGQGLGPFRAWGIDAGVGIGRTSVDPEGDAGDTTDTGLLLHAGLPLVLSANRHMAVQLIPEINIGLASGERGNLDVSGNRFDLGARAGAEVFFGFMGLPNLALDASVGFFLSRQGRSEEVPGAGDAESTTWFFGTTKFNDPWDIFRANIGARYYF